MNKRDAATVAILITASHAVDKPIEGDRIPEEDADRVNDSAQDWAWAVLARYGLEHPFPTSNDAYEWVRDYRSKKGRR